MNILQISIILITTFTQTITANEQQESVFNNGTCNSNTFNGTEGIITTPGYPSNLSFNRTCFCKIEVGDGKIEVTIETVSLPDGSRFGVPNSIFTVGVHSLRTRVVYVPSDTTFLLVSLGSSANSTDGYGGVKFSYRRISDDVCKLDLTAHSIGETIDSPGYPQSVKVNSTCVYNLHASSPGHVIHIGFEDFSFGPNDVFTMYDNTENSTIFGPLTGHQGSIQTEPTKSVSVRIVVVTNIVSSVRQRYIISYKEVPKDTCLKDYYGDGGMEQRVSSVAKPCSYIIRPERSFSRVVIWFESLALPENNFITVDLMSFSDRLITSYNLSSNSSGRSEGFDGLNRGNYFKIRQSAGATFILKFKTYNRHNCPFYHISDPIGSQVSNPGYPGPFPSNSSCEYYIRSRDQSSVVYIRLSEKSLSPEDKLTVYDASDGHVIARYNGTEGLTLSLTTNSPSVRAVFTFGKTKRRQRNWFYHQTVPPGSCVVDYRSKIGQFSSFNRPCEYNIYLANYMQFELKLENIFIPVNGSIKLVQKGEFSNDRPLANFNSSDSGKTKFFRSGGIYNVITILSTEASVVFNVSLWPFIQDRTIYVHGSSGTLLSPFYPNSYLIQQFRHSSLTFHVEVPRGHVLLNFTEIELSAVSYHRDFIDIFDGNTTSAKRLWRIQAGTPEKLPTVFLGSSNHLTIRFGSYSEFNTEKLYRFKAAYRTLINVNYCKPIQWPHSHPERNLTLPGRKTKFLCNEGYSRKGTFYRGVTRTCRFDGDWEDGETLACLKICPRLDEKLKENSSLYWRYSSFYSRIVDGDYATFSCNYKEELIGPRQIWCTSHGNYSAVPPVCKKKPDRGSDDDSSGDGWKYGVGFGGAAFIIGIVLAGLRICFGCFACCAENSSASSMPMSDIKYSNT